MSEPVRCWPTSDPLYIAYHDEEWGRPVRDEHRLLERLCLEGFQSGLAWITILRKRENFRAAFRGFDPEQVARFGDADVERLMADAGIVRNRAKIVATIANARATVALHEAGETLDALLWSFAPPARARAARSLQDMPADDARVQGARARAQAARLSLRRPDDRLRAHAGDRNRQRSPRRCIVRDAVQADIVAARTLLVGNRWRWGDGRRTAGCRRPGRQHHAGRAASRGRGAARAGGVPLSALHEGRFGRMFRDPRPLEPGSTRSTRSSSSSRRAARRPPATTRRSRPATRTSASSSTTTSRSTRCRAAEGQRPRRARRLPHAALRPGLAVRLGTGRRAFMYEWSSPTNRGVKLLVGRNPRDGEFDTPTCRATSRGAR